MSTTSRHLIDPGNVFVETGPSAVFGKVPSWWISFIFHVLNGRQLSLYLYLIMLMGDSQVCHPTTQEIANDLGLASATMIFDAINALEVGGFILRSRRHVAQTGSRRNVYQRPSCEYTILSLLRNKRIDGCLRTVQRHQDGPPEGAALRRVGLRELLGEDFARYCALDSARKAAFLEHVLHAKVARRNGGSPNAR